MRVFLIILFLSTLCFGAVGDTEYGGDLLPDTTATYDVGSVSLKWDNIHAVTYNGDGSALTGIGTGTGGVINTGSTTIGADSDADGSGVVVLQTRGITRLTVANNGDIQIAGTITSGTWNGTAIDISSFTNLVAGTNITLAGDTLNVDDAFVINSGSDTMTGVLTSDGLTITTTNALTLGVVRWDDGADKIEGNQLANDSVDDDALDFTSITLNDFTVDIASTQLTDTATIMYLADFDTFAELQTQIADKTLVNEEDAATIDSTWTFSAGITGNLTGNVIGNVTGNADTAELLLNTRTFSVSGDTTAAGVTFNGGGNVDLVTAITPGVIVDGDVSGVAAISADKLADGATNAIVTLTQESNWDTHLSSDGSDHTFIDQSVISGASPVLANTNMTGNVSVWTNDAGYLTSLSTEEVQDITGGMVSGNVETLISVTYDDAGGKLDFVVDEASISHNALANFQTNEHFTQLTITQVGTVVSGIWNAAQIDIGTFTNLAAGTNLTLVNDTINLDDPITVDIIGEATSVADNDFGDVNIVGGFWNVETISGAEVVLGTGTVGDYVSDITAGEGIDSTGSAAGETVSHTLTFDSTELSALTWNDGSNPTSVWSFNLTGTDHTMTAGSGVMTFSNDLTVVETITGGTLTDSTASIVGGVGSGFTSLAINTLTISEVAGDATIAESAVELVIDGHRGLTLKATGPGGAVVILDDWNATGQTCTDLGTVSAATSITSTIFSDGTATLTNGILDLGTNTITDLAMTGAWDLNSGALTNVNIDSGTIDGTVIGGATPSDGDFTKIVVDNITLNLNTISSASDITISTGGNLSVIGNIVPSISPTLNLGSAASQWQDLFISRTIDLGTNTITDLAMTGAWDLNSGALTNVNIDSGTIDGTPIVGSTGSFTTLAASGVTTLQDQLIIDTDSTEALLVRKDSDGGDLLVADTVNGTFHVITDSASGAGVKFTSFSRTTPPFSKIPELEASGPVDIFSIKDQLYIRTSGTVSSLVFSNATITTNADIRWDSSTDAMSFNNASGGYFFMENIVLLDDNKKIQIGATVTDFELYSDGTDAQIEATTNLDIFPAGVTTIGDGGTTNYTQISAAGNITQAGTANAILNIDGGSITGTPISGSTGSFTTLAASTSLTSTTTNNLDNGTVDAIIIGGSTPAAGSFTTLTASTSLTSATTNALTNGTIENIVIGGVTPANGFFTAINATGDITLSGDILTTGAFQEIGVVSEGFRNAYIDDKVFFDEGASDPPWVGGISNDLQLDGGNGDVVANTTFLAKQGIELISNKSIVFDSTTGSNASIVHNSSTNDLEIRTDDDIKLFNNLLGTTATFTDVLTTEAAVGHKTLRVTGNTTLSDIHHEVFCDTDGGAFTVTLPAGVDGRTYRIINTGSNVLTVAPDGSELLKGVNESKTMSEGVVILTYNVTEGWW